MVLINKPIIFQDTSTGNISSLWNFGDSTPEVTGKTVSHTYNATGTYRVLHTITSAAGDSKTCYQDVVVSNVPPVSTKNIPGIVTASSIAITIIITAYLLTRK